ncbi:MAG: sigma-54-dependent Fis family transcriptional regulator [Magnetococcales bacterium]|nr:sigma-54-dependent Fis family transcriptional regulator [Magnetococcales bacterium]
MTSNTDCHPKMQGQSPPFLAMLRSARLVAATRAPVLIQGESGTGKELLAQFIHEQSPRHRKSFIAINCAALPEALAESELFGHAKGAFTGANTAREGRIAAAQYGTLFLDEIGEMPLTVQSKLLRFLESGECQVLGEGRSIHIDTRIIAATNRGLADLVQQGRFRNDLYYRLQVVPLEVPPLRQRSDDIEPLAQQFLQWFSRHHGVAAPQLTDPVRRMMHRWSWPGNIRELRNLCERLVILHSGSDLAIEHLPHEIRACHPTTERFPAADFPITGISLEHLERELIMKALAHAGGNRSRAARLLDLSRDTLLYRIKKHGLQTD